MRRRCFAPFGAVIVMTVLLGGCGGSRSDGPDPQGAASAAQLQSAADCGDWGACLQWLSHSFHGPVLGPEALAQDRLIDAGISPQPGSSNGVHFDYDPPGRVVGPVQPFVIVQGFTRRRRSIRAINNDRVIRSRTRVRGLPAQVMRDPSTDVLVIQWNELHSTWMATFTDNFGEAKAIAEINHYVVYPA